ncbi:hypothetical protein [Companilactobacillus paralimentarius]
MASADIFVLSGDITYFRYNGMTHAFKDKVDDFVQADDCPHEVIEFILK